MSIHPADAEVIFRNDQFLVAVSEQAAWPVGSQYQTPAKEMD